jgi:glycosyltransferase involved in cell wall biosynthesis
MIEFSACILSYNRPLYLKESLLSLLKQTVKPGEIIIFDNASTLISKEDISYFVGLGARWVGSEVTKNPNWNFRRAITASVGKNILVLHDDDRVCENFIEKQLNFLDSNPKIGAVSSNGYLIDSEGHRTGKFIFNEFQIGKVKYFNSSFDVAHHYASDLCIPFSPTVYKSDFIQKCEIRDDVGKVSDAVLFCDLADEGFIALQEEPLYECRIHNGQDSAIFYEENFAILEDLFIKISLLNGNKGLSLRKLLSEQKTRRMLIRLKLFLKKIFIDKEFSNFDMDGFSIINISKILFKAIKKRI